MSLALELVVRTTVLVLAAAALARVMAGASAASRHLLWTGVLAAAIILPLARIALPAWPVAILPPPAIAPAIVLPASTYQPVPDALTAMPVAVAGQVTVSSRPAVAARTTVTVMDVVLAVWGLVCAGFVCRLLVGAARIWRLRTRSAPVTESVVLERVEQARAHFHVRRSIAALTSPDESMPMTWGLVRPTLLLPSAMLTPAASPALAAVILHEVAHIARVDAIGAFIARLAMALHWFNPLVWFAVRRAQLERERACDDAVLAAGTVASDYATQLLTFVRSALGPAEEPAALAMAGRTQLEARVQSILDGRAIRGGCSRASVWLTVALIAAALPMAVVRVTARTIDRGTSAIVTIQGPAESSGLDQAPVRRAGRPIQLPSLVAHQATSKRQGGVTGTEPQPQKHNVEPLTDELNVQNVSRVPDNLAAPAQATSNYVIGAGDVLRITVWRSPDVSGDVRVEPDGKIRLPIGNPIAAAGWTASGLRDAITIELKRFLVAPEVLVEIRQINSRKAFFFFNDTLPPGQTMESMLATARGDEWDFMVTTLRDRAAKTEHDIATKVEIGTMAAIDQSEFRRVTPALNALTAWSHPPTNAQAAALRSRFTDAVRNIDTVQIRFDNGLATIQQMADAYLAAADVFKEPPPGQLTMPPLLSDADLIVALKTAAILYPDAARADKLIDLAQRHALTPEMVALYVAAANGIAADTEKARVFAQQIRVKGK